MAYVVIWKPEGLEIKLKGIVTFSDLLKLNQEIYDSIHFGSISYRITDLSEIKYFQLSDAEISALGTMDRVASMWTPRVRNAFVGCTQNLLSLYLHYQDQLEKSNWETKFFSGIDDAKEWAYKNEEILVRS